MQRTGIAVADGLRPPTGLVNGLWGKATSISFAATYGAVPRISAPNQSRKAMSDSRLAAELGFNWVELILVQSRKAFV
jgi:hypothetical protein